MRWLVRVAEESKRQKKKKKSLAGSELLGFSRGASTKSAPAASSSLHRLRQRWQWRAGKKDSQEIVHRERKRSSFLFPPSSAAAAVVQSGSTSMWSVNKRAAPVGDFEFEELVILSTVQGYLSPVPGIKLQIVPRSHYKFECGGVLALKMRRRCWNLATCAVIKYT